MSSKVAPRRLKGFQDYSPELMAKRVEIIQTARDFAHRSGFYEIGTPALEYAEVLLGVGGETDKQVFRFLDGGERDVALRYDLTVPFARYAAENYGQLVLPFKRLQIGDVWRAEKPQKGRFREFCQCDIDIIGVDSMAADLEILVNIQHILNQVVQAPFTISCNNRKILSFLIRKILGLHTAEKETQALILLDKLDKIGKENLIQQMKDNLHVAEGRCGDMIDLITQFTQEDPSSLTKLFDDELIRGEWERFQTTVKTVQKLAANSFANIVMDLSIARGLAYYTGIVFETRVDGVPGFGSVCSGGRYDNLAERFVDHEMPGVGISIGVDRLTALLCEKEGAQIKAPASVFIAVAGQELIPFAFETALRLRMAGVATDIALREQKLGAQFKNADKRGFPWVLVLGTEEWQGSCYTLKNMKTGQEDRSLTWEALLAKVSVK